MAVALVQACHEQWEATQQPLSANWLLFLDFDLDEEQIIPAGKLVSHLAQREGFRRFDEFQESGEANEFTIHFVIPSVQRLAWRSFNIFRAPGVGIEGADEENRDDKQASSDAKAI
ncbi:hypothetical protein PG997_006417 [Apiospora hydei]|uniref:Uncharacterized protein n=1 Tax=Apiospora hydei TaxID=1337664 RepID=A0ABR1WRI8_9PEZI